MTLYLSSSRVFRTEAKFKYEFQLKVTVYIKEFEGRLLLSISEATWYSHENNTRDKNMRYSFHQSLPASVGVVQGASVLGGRLIPPPLTDIFEHLTELALLTRFESRNTTITVMSSWKCRRTPRSIFFRSEYLISLFFAASCKAAFTSLLALPCMNKPNNFINGFILKFTVPRALSSQ